MKRAYQSIIREHLAQYRQMVFLSGPRQAGKTTLAIDCVKGQYSYQYLNWDNIKDRELILSGIDKIYQKFQPNVLKQEKKPAVIIFDEIHKYNKWKNLLKGYFDVIQNQCKIIVTGSAKLNAYRRGGDSMMGRYFLYRIHPLSVAEILGRSDFRQETCHPKKISEKAWRDLITFSGFPEPFLEDNNRFYQRWVNLKHEQLFKEDLRDLSKVHDLARLELLSQLLTRQVGSVTRYSELAKKIQVSEPTIRQWLSILQNLYFCFSISPWSKNVSRSILKEPKTYLYDWSIIEDPGAKIENLVASHLLKAVNFWTDIGLGEYSLHYLRDKDNHEVDFLIVKNKSPWLMVEVKSSNNDRISPNIIHFNKSLSVPHVLQVVEKVPFINKDCFALNKPTIVPLSTFLSQLI